MQVPPRFPQPAVWHHVSLECFQVQCSPSWMWLSSGGLRIPIIFYISELCLGGKKNTNVESFFFYWEIEFHSCAAVSMFNTNWFLSLRSKVGGFCLVSGRLKGWRLSPNVQNRLAAIPLCFGHRWPHSYSSLGCGVRSLETKREKRWGRMGGAKVAFTMPTSSAKFVTSTLRCV